MGAWRNLREKDWKCGMILSQTTQCTPGQMQKIRRSVPAIRRLLVTIRNSLVFFSNQCLHFEKYVFSDFKKYIFNPSEFLWINATASNWRTKCHLTCLLQSFRSCESEKLFCFVQSKNKGLFPSSKRRNYRSSRASAFLANIGGQPLEIKPQTANQAQLNTFKAVERI